MDSSVGEVNGKDTAGLGMAGDREDLAELFHEEYADWHVEVCVAGLLVVVEYADSVLSATENTPPLLPALWRGRGERREREE